MVNCSYILSAYIYAKYPFEFKFIANEGILNAVWNVVMNCHIDILSIFLHRIIAINCICHLPHSFTT